MKKINLNFPKALLDEDTIAAGLESDVYALPDRMTTLTYQTFFGVAPASCTFILWGGLDPDNLSSLSSSTTAAGAVVTVVTNVKFIMAELDAVSGGSDGVSVLLVAKDQ
jgi:hypothetical protein